MRQSGHAGGIAEVDGVILEGFHIETLEELAVDAQIIDCSLDH